MQCEYEYVLGEEIGKNFHPEFTPAFTPSEMLAFGVFEGKYLNDCFDEFPEEWFSSSTQKRSELPDVSKNYFGVKSRLSLSEWKKRGWIAPDDPDVRGWFQWYCRYFLGRRDPILDERQIKRWKAFRRHAGQIKKHCASQDLNCRKVQRQALLQWAHDAFI